MNAIEVNNLTKIYRLYTKPKDRLREIISLQGKKYHHEFHALKDVSFTLEKGQNLGIIGQNGSGKSTLLKIICGVLQPTTGSVKVNGRISSLLELGAGFHPEFTGRENVYMNGALMGLSREEIDQRFSDIEAFADIGEFIDQPVKTYSSGMYVRLAFATAISVDPEILIVDEALSVGDMFFQSKCMAKIKKMIDQGITLLFVSHDLGAVKSLCAKGILLCHGELLGYDVADNVVEKYIAMMVESEQEVLGSQTEINEPVTLGCVSSTKDNQILIFSNNSKFQKRGSFQRIQNGKAGFANVQLLNEQGEEVISLDYEQDVTLKMAIEIHEHISVLCFGYQIKSSYGVEIICSDSVIEDKNLLFVKKGDKYIIDWKFKASLTHGNYTIAVALSIPISFDMGQVEFCDRVPCAVQFKVQPRTGWYLYGIAHWINNLNVEKYDN